MRVVLIALALLVAIMGAGLPARADNFDHPGSCLSVQNHTDLTVKISLNYPTVSGSWVYAPGEGPSILTDDNGPIKSPNGNWNVHANQNVSLNFGYDPGRNSGKGCNGSWILTLN